MKILHISTSDTGGAANACIRLHQGLLEQGADSKVLVFIKKRSIPEVYKLHDSEYFKFLQDKFAYFKYGWHEGLNRFKLSGRNPDFEIFTKPRSLLHPENHPLFEWAEIINLHWSAYFIDFPSFFKNVNKKFIWTIHDMNPFTGGCHHSRECDKFTSDCDLCPQLEGTKDLHYAEQNLLIKKNALKNISDLKIISPSKWLLNKSKQSALFSRFEHHHIPNGIDENVFKPQEKIRAREILSFPQDKKILLFVSDWVERKGKGFTFLNEAQNRMESVQRPLLCVAGKTNLQLAGEDIIKLGYVTDEKKMSLIYSACDAYVLPSLEENLPNTIIESMLCGTPVIAFPVGGIPEMISNRINGLLCTEISTDSLRNTIEKFLTISNGFDGIAIREHAIKNYGLFNQAVKYLEIYKNIL